MRALVALVALVATTGTAAADQGDRWSGTTMALQATTGVVGGLFGSTLCGLAGYGIGKAISDDKWTPALAGLLFGSIGGLTGITAGVTLTGDQRDSTGHWWGAALGSVGGTLVAVGTLVALDKADIDLRGVGSVIVSVVGILGGSVVGYQLSADRNAHPVPLMSVAF